MNRAHRRAATKKRPTTPPAPRSDKLAALWCSNSPLVPTGYGTQTAQVTRRMLADGHSVAIANNYGVEGVGLDVDGLWIYPRGLAAYSDDVIQAYSVDWKHRHKDKHPIVFTLYDVWVYAQNESLKQIPRIYSWVPIDHQPCPPQVMEWCKRSNVTPIAMSRFGKEMLESEGVKCEYAPHAIERVFQPTPTVMLGTSKVDPRELMSIPKSAFVVMMNAANKGHAPIRKSFGEALLGFSIFAQKHSDAVLYLHTEKSSAASGIDLESLVAASGIPERQVRFVDQFAYRRGIPDQMLAALYTMSDVLLAPSKGEGFGIPVVEAQACGTRVIVSEWTAQPELVGDGWMVGGQPEWDPLQGSWFFTPNVAEIVNALEKSYAAPRGPSEKAIAFAEAYDADRVFDEAWRPILKRAAA